jgi:predicted DNA-binding transcriptional regulator YafY
LFVIVLYIFISIGEVMKKSQLSEARFKRLFQILAHLSPHSYDTIKDLSEKYEVTERTIQRDIEVLLSAELGVFVDEENRVRISRQGMKLIGHWIMS